MMCARAANSNNFALLQESDSSPQHWHAQLAMQAQLHPSTAKDALEDLLSLTSSAGSAIGALAASDSSASAFALGSSSLASRILASSSADSSDAVEESDEVVVEPDPAERSAPSVTLHLLASPDKADAKTAETPKASPAASSAPKEEKEKEQKHGEGGDSKANGASGSLTTIIRVLLLCVSCCLVISLQD